MTEPVIVTDRLVKHFGTVEALGPLTVEVPGGAWGLLGPNGAGKTTLIRLLLGLTPATRGQGRVLGLDPSQRPLAVRERVGFVPEHDAFVPGRTGVQYVTLAGRLSGLPRDDARHRAHDALDFVGLDEARYRVVEDYSQGMRQRAKLAQAIVHDPDLLVLDEPTNGLDPDGRDEMLTLIEQLARDHGLTVLMASHILPDVERVCDGALVLQNGQAVANGPMEELMATRESRYLVRVRGPAEELSARLEKVGGRVEPTPEGLLVVHLAAAHGPRAILAAAHEAGLQVRHLESARETLEDSLMATLEEAST